MTGPSLYPAPPPSVGKLEKYILAYAREEGLAVNRVRRWVSFMVLSGALDRATTTDNSPAFVVKGGVAMELRLPGHARATDDLDVVVVSRSETPVAALDQALSSPYREFSFTRKPQTHELGERGTRVEVKVAYRGQSWATVAIDLTRPDFAAIETERLGGIPLSTFGLVGPADIVCLSVRYQIAQKFHAMTAMPENGRENVRFRDAIDLLLLRELVDDLVLLREACEVTFLARAQHTWPPEIVFPDSWHAPFATMAAELNLPVLDPDAAAVELRSFLDAIVSA